MRIGLMGAMLEEVKRINDLFPNPKKEVVGERKYYQDSYAGHEVISVYSRCGKVSAAATAMTLIHQYNVDLILFTGAAGSVQKDVCVGDIVVGKSLYQHDMDGRPLFKKFEIPLSGRTLFESPAEIIEKGVEAAKMTLGTLQQYIGKKSIDDFNLHNAINHLGTIASGDQFIQSASCHENLSMDGQNVLAVEMEGAALAQVCTEYSIPFLVIRTISDNADQNASFDFQEFITDVASLYSKEIVKNFIQSI